MCCDNMVYVKIFFMLFVIFSILTVSQIAYGQTESQQWRDYLELYKQYMEDYKEWATNIISNYENKIKSLENDVSVLERELSIVEPRYEAQTVIKDTVAHIQFYDSKNNYYDWIVPISEFESTVLKSNVKSYLGQKLTGDVNQDSFWSKLKFKFKEEIADELGIDTVLLNNNGRTFSFQDFTSFKSLSFVNTVDSIYDNSDSNSDFIWEVWYVVSQLTVYDKDVNPNSEGRYPLETMIRTGGDCEDLSILIADMLKSSKYTKDWIIQLVYLDADNPTNPINLNHVIVYVNDGTNNYYIESTSSPNWDYFPNGIVGWFYDF